MFHLVAFGEDDFDWNAVALPDGLHHAIGLVGETAGVQREDADGGGDARRQIEDHHAFLLKAGGDGERIAERIDGPGKNVRSRSSLEAQRRLSNLYQD